MNAGRVSRLLLLTLAVQGPGVALGQPDAAPGGEPPPHVMRLEGTGAQIVREGATEPVELGSPMLFGDRIDTGVGTVQVLWGDGTRIALDRDTRLEALAPDLLALTAGRAVVVRPVAATTSLRMDTPAATLVLRPAGEYRVSLEGDVTTLAVVRGQVDVQNAMGTAEVGAGQQVALRDGLAPEAPRRFNAAAYDSFAQWATAPAEAPATGAPLDTFADPKFEAYSDVFNRYGSWETDAAYGAVWYPTVPVDWRPYSDGYWQPWGAQNAWLWVGRDPWGWPTHHFGRWGMNPRGRWYWMPGRTWAPAHVQWSVGPGYIGWTPLGHGDRPVSGWNDLARPRGVYPGGTLDPGRAWTVVPSDRFGRRDGMRAFAVDPRTLANLSAFVTQPVGPPLRGVGPAGGFVGGYGYGGAYGGGRGRGGYGAPTGSSTTGQIRGGIGPTRVGPPAPGYGGPTPPPEDPYERAQRAAAPRGRMRTPPRADAPATPPPAEAAPAPAEDGPAPAQPRPRTPPKDTPPPQANRSAGVPADGAAAPPARAGGNTSRATGTTTGRRAIPRP